MNDIINTDVSSDTARQQTDSNSDTTIVSSPNRNQKPASEAATTTSQINTSTGKSRKLTLSLSRLADHNACSNIEQTATYSSRRKSKTLDVLQQEYDGAVLSVEQDIAEFLSCRYDRLSNNDRTEQLDSEIKNRIRLMQGGFDYAF